MSGVASVWLVLSLVLLVFSLSVIGTRVASAAESGAPAHLQCEAMTEPFGIDIQHPRLSWWVQDARRGAKQTAYEIRVASSAEKLAQEQADVWDSGRVASEESVNVLYGGPAVESRRRYYWQVRTWDAQGQTSAYSAASWWEMGLLSPQDWKGKWITRDLPEERDDYASGVKWIWAANENGLANASPGKHEFRLHFNLASAPKVATLYITAKDNVAAWINGKPVVESSPVTGYGNRDGWGHFRVADAGKFLSKGANVIAAEVLVNKSDGGNATAGLVAMLRVQTADGKVQRLVSGPEWKAASEQGGNWFEKGFDDASWPASVAIADMGQQPFGTAWPAQPASLLRKSFSVAKTVKSARIYSTALGAYQLYLNGKRVGNDILAPGWTDYTKRIVYQTYDVTSQVKQGANALAAILGDGWYASGLTWLQTRYNFGPPPLRLLVQLEVEYSDGSRDSVVSDESWTSARSAILMSEIYSGEDYDARREAPGWDTAGFKDGGWGKVVSAAAPEAPLVAEDFPPIREKQTLKPKTMTNPKPGVYVFDLGQNMVGWARLHVSGKPGTKVQMRFAEVLQNNGELYTDNLRTAAVTDTYTLRGKGAEVFEPHFTFHGFRYIELTGYPGTPAQDAVEGVVFHTDSPFTIQFKTGNSIVNQLASNILWGQRGNFLSVPTDCPQRDERLGWMGDAEVFWRTAAFNADLASFSHKFAADMRDAQRPSGGYTDVSPYLGNVSDSVAGWGDAGVIIPWAAYLQYRDTRMLEENWGAMEKWMAHLEGANPNHLWLKERGNDYGDWLAIGSETSKDMIATAYWAYDASLMVRIAEALGRADDAEKYREVFDKVRAAFNKEYVKPDGTVGTGSQTSDVLALHMNLLPAGLRATVAEKLVADIKAHNGHLTTGFLGTPYLMLELSNSGHSDVAYSLLFNKTYPSWGYMIEHGATTMWERWNGDQMMGDPSMNSYNHYAYGAVAEWLYRYAAGIDEDAEDPGFHRIVMHPQFNRDLGEASATYESGYGPIRSAWKAGGGTVSWDVEVPANTTALLYFPGDATAKITEGGKDVRQADGVSFVLRDPRKAVYAVGAGKYSFVIQR